MLNKDELTSEERIFFDAATGSGLPASDDEFDIRMQELADAAALPIANANRYSAFWNFVKAAVREPLRSLVRVLVTKILPGLYVKTAAGGSLDLLAWAYGIERKAGAKARGRIVFSRGSTVVGEVEIPAGTLVRTHEIDGRVYRMATLADAVIATGDASAAVLCEAEETGSAYNLGRGYYSLLDSDVPNVAGATNAADYLDVPGADEESDAELRLRIRDRFLAVGGWHTDARYRAIITERTGISADRVFFYRDDDYAPATVDAFIIFDAGETPQTYLDDLNDHITNQGNHGHGDVLRCKALPDLTKNLAVTISAVAGTSPAAQDALAAGVEDAIRCAFWGNTDYRGRITRSAPYSVFSFSRLAQELHGLFPALYSVVFSSSDFESGLELPKLGTLTVTIGDTTEAQE